MIGGISWPPVEATASTAAANGGRKPVRFISGMVIGPSTITFATALPETVPNNDELTTARRRRVLTEAADTHERTETA